MRKELEKIYIPLWEQCQCNKGPTKCSAGPHHPLSIPDGHCHAFAIDFIGKLPNNASFNRLATVTCCLGSDYKFIPCQTNTTAPQFAELFFNHWYYNHGLPNEIISNCSKLFVSKFWSSLHKLTGTKLRMLTFFIHRLTVLLSAQTK